MALNSDAQNDAPNANGVAKINFKKPLQFTHADLGKLILIQ